jgi:hypothetical protein
MKRYTKIKEKTSGLSFHGRQVPWGFMTVIHKGGDG